jgi:Fic family protein
METIFTHWEEIPLTENHIKQLHRDLLQFSPKDERHRGSYKTLDNHVEAIGPDGESLGVVFRTASPFDTPRLMAELTEWLRDEQKAQNLHPLILIAVFIAVFLEIHPFQDGNGRLSRILTTLVLLRSGYSYQGSLLPGTSPDAGNDPVRCPELAALASLLPRVAAETEIPA